MYFCSEVKRIHYFDWSRFPSKTDLMLVVVSNMMKYLGRFLKVAYVEAKHSAEQFGLMVWKGKGDREA